MSERILFVTGRLAEPALRDVLARLAVDAGFQHDVAVMKISVAALMHVDWIRTVWPRQGFEPPTGYGRVILPGWCQGDAAALVAEWGTAVERGPKDLYDLPEFFGRGSREPADLSRYDVEILAEINHAPRMDDREILAAAASYRQSGADVVDVGCIPGETWTRAGVVVRMLTAEGFRVSIDSFDRAEVEAAVEAGAELVLSVNSTNFEWAAELDAELVAIPDEPSDLESLADVIDELASRGCRFRIDPVIEPIGFGFAASLARYFECRRRWPEVPMMMGVGNLTELTEVDTAGVNVLLAAVCQELEIHSVLTTEVINWARSAVAEFDLARRLVRHAVSTGSLPKHVDSRLVMLRDPKVVERGESELTRLAGSLTDPNYRIFVERGEIHVMNRDGYWRGDDAFELFDRFAAESAAMEPSHAFYLGYELAKAVTALTLGKQYTQDESLRWGFLTVPEQSALERRREKS